MDDFVGGPLDSKIATLLEKGRQTSRTLRPFAIPRVIAYEEKWRPLLHKHKKASQVIVSRGTTTTAYDLAALRDHDVIDMTITDATQFERDLYSILDCWSKLVEVDRAGLGCIGVSYKGLQKFYAAATVKYNTGVSCG